MKVVLVGQRSFGAAVLGLIHPATELAYQGVELVEVWCPPTPDDKLRLAAQRFGIPMGEPRPMPGVDLIVAAHSHKFLGQRTRKSTTLGAIGYHPSLLPRHRGIDAVAWTVKMGDPVAGGSVYWLDNGVDTGPIAKQDWCHVRPGWKASDLWREELFPMGVRLLEATLRDLLRGQVVQDPQEEDLATWEPKLDAPPLHRPELIEIGRFPDGFELVVNSRHA